MVEKIFTTIAKEIFDLGRLMATVPPPVENSSNATVIRGNSKWNTCWRHACYLSKYIYKDPPSPEGFHTQFPEKMAQIEQDWEEWDERIDQSDSGFVARLFKVKGYDPSAKTDVCPPTLVYRGTDFEDMRDMAIAATIRLSWWPFWWTFENIYVLDNTLDPDSTREELLEAGFESIPFYTEEEGAILIETGLDGVGVELGIALTLEILVKENGDWANNFQQGLGKGSEQYRNAIEYGRNVVEEKIKLGNDKRLELTGHSLGGGLASAACAMLERKFPTVSFHAIVFNPAGVHPNTIFPATGADGLINVFAVKDDILTTLQSYPKQLPLVGSVFRLARTAISQDGMPEALGTFLLKEGISPGKSKEKWAVPAKGEPLPTLFPINEQTLIPPPKPGGFPELANLDLLLFFSPSVSLFANNLLRYLNTWYRAYAEEAVSLWSKESWAGVAVGGSVGGEIGGLVGGGVGGLVGGGVGGTVGGVSGYSYALYKEMTRHYWADLKPEVDALSKIIDASVSYHAMDYVIATYEHYFGET